MRINYVFVCAQFGWTHVTLLLVVITSHCIIANIFHGLIWCESFAACAFALAASECECEFECGGALQVRSMTIGVPVGRIVVPSLLIIGNDIFAYLFGFFFGRHPLIQLSPKKTWEGFIGGAIATVIAGQLVRAPPSLAFSS